MASHKRPRDLDETGASSRIASELDLPSSSAEATGAAGLLSEGLADPMTDHIRDADVVDPMDEVLDEEDDEIALERQLFEQDEEELEGEGEDLFGDNFERDYRENSHLDNYDAGDIDDNQYSELSIGDRVGVEAMLDRRDRQRARMQGRIPAAFLGDDDEMLLARMPRRRRHRQAGGYDDLDEEEAYDPNVLDPNFDLVDLKGRTVAEWVSLDQPRRHIKHRFRKFLVEFTSDRKQRVYSEKIQRMCEANGHSLEVSYIHLQKDEPTLALWVADAPTEMFKIFDEVTTELVKESFEFYSRISDEIKVRLTDLPQVEKIRDLRHYHVNRLIRVHGVVTRRSTVIPQLRFVMYGCGKCDFQMGPFAQTGIEEVKPAMCASCQSKGPFLVKSDQSAFRDYQRMTLQEAPGQVPPGRLPRHKDVILLGDLVDTVRPGEEVEITGVYRNIFDVSLNANNGFPLFATVIEANYISKQEDTFASYRLDNDDKAKIAELGRDPRIARRVFKSIAPSIYGHENIKTAIALALVGGESKNIQGKHRLRGDINILMMGDPGTAKSQFLKYIERTASRAVFATGQGASAVGLTASVQRSPVTREWTLEGGALVLADKGVCLIDEFDKMNDQDRTSIHEAMEQQSISISKAGIVCTLQARCAVIAAANPKTGRYNPIHSFQENVDLTEPILSRFDVLCVVKDTIDVEIDERLARFVVQSHQRSHPEFDGEKQAGVEQDPDIIDQDLLRKYIMYAKDTVHPRLNNLDQDKLARVYSSLRKESLACGSIPMTVRHVESMIRMAEAHAKLHLRDFVRQDDLDLAIQMMLDSFLAANKSSVLKTLKRKFQKYMVTSQDNEELLHHILKNLANEQYKYYLFNNPDVRRRIAAASKQKKTSGDIFADGDDGEDAMDMEKVTVEVEADEFELRAREMNIHDVTGFYGSFLFRNNGYQMESRQDVHGRDYRVILKTV